MSNLSDFMGGGGGLIVKRELFTANGTWTKPAGLKGGQVWVTMIGGGSAGNGSSSTEANGGNSGQFVQRLPVNVASETSVSVTVGAGGVGTGAVGGAGGVSSFGALVSCSGGVAPSALYRGNSDNSGGALGGLDFGSYGMVIGGTSPGGVFGGPPGLSRPNIGAGAGGLVLDGSGTTADQSGSNSFAGGGSGYGAGSGGHDSGASDSDDGAPGAVMIEWLEAV